MPPAVTATATTLPPTRTQTPVVPTATAVPPTATSASPTETLTPVSVSAPDQIPIAGILSSLEGLPIGQFVRESYRQLQLGDPDSLVANGFADFYGLVPGGQFTDFSPDYIRETQQLEREILDLLRTYDRDLLAPEQKPSYDLCERVLDDLVAG